MKRSLLTDLGAIFVQYRVRLLAAFVMVAVSNGLLVLNPVIFRVAVMVVDPTEEPTGLGRAALSFLGPSVTSVWTWVPVLLVVAAVAAFLKYRMRVAFIAVSRDAEAQLRTMLFDRLTQQSRAFFDRHRIGGVMSRLTNDIAAYREVLGPGMMYPINFATIALPAFVAMFFISKPLALLSLLPVLILPMLILCVRQFFYRTYRNVHETLADMNTEVQEHYSAIRLDKSYVVEKQVLGRFRTLCRRFLRINMRHSFYQGLFWPLVTLFTRAVTVLMVLMAGFIIMRGWGKLSRADFVSLMWIQSYLYIPVLMLGWILPVYERGRASYDRLLEIYYEPIEVMAPPYRGEHFPKDASIVVKNLNFSYPGSSDHVLKDVTFNIACGQFVGITGPVGAGKSTLLRLLNRDYEVAEGRIFLGGRDIKEWPLQVLHEVIGVVQQRPFVFSKTIRDNIGVNGEKASEEQVKMAAELADLTETIASFSQRYDTFVGERGVTLSGGQKSRLAMARAFLVNGSILLFDNVFSAVDTATEQKIFTRMRQHFQGKTVLLVTHRVSVLEQMDQILYMVGGSIVESGLPKDLVEKKGHYAALVELQTMEERLYERNW